MLAEFWGWCRYIKVQVRNHCFANEIEPVFILFSIFNFLLLKTQRQNRLLTHSAKPRNYFYWTLFVAYYINCKDIVILKPLLLITLKC